MGGGVGTAFSFKAPKLVAFFNEIGIDIHCKNNVFTERTQIALPSGKIACVYNEMAQYFDIKTLYGTEQMGMPRQLDRIETGASFAKWFIDSLINVGEQYLIERFDNVEDSCADFCQEAKGIVNHAFPGENDWQKIEELDDLIEKAQVLYLSSWGGIDFVYTYAEMKNGKASYCSGSGWDDEDFYEDWYWRSFHDFIRLVKERIPAITYKRVNGKWIEYQRNSDWVEEKPHYGSSEFVKKRISKKADATNATKKMESEDRISIAKEKVTVIVNELKNRYPQGGDLPNSFEELKFRNADLPLSTLNNWTKIAYQTKARDYLIQEGLLSGPLSKK